MGDFYSSTTSSMSDGIDSSSGSQFSLKKMRKDDSLWEETQKKTFCGWINMHLSKKNMHVADLQTDLCDGVKLIALLEILNGSKIEGRYYRNPKSKPYKIDNVNFALNFITDNLKITLISCSAEDIVDGNVKIILGMLWRLIQRFQLSQDNSRTALLQWCKQATHGHDDVSVENFQTSFENGLAFCALIDNYDSSLIDYSSLKAENKMQNLNLAFNLLEERLDIPPLLDAADVSNGLVDERSVMTYLSMINRAYSEKKDGVVAADVSAPVEAPAQPSAGVVTTSAPSATAQVAQSKLTEAKDTIESLQKENAELTAKVSRLEGEVSTLQERVTAAEAKAAQSTPRDVPEEVKEEAPKEEEPKEEEPKDSQTDSALSEENARLTSELQKAQDALREAQSKQQAAEEKLAALTSQAASEAFREAPVQEEPKEEAKEEPAPEETKEEEPKEEAKEETRDAPAAQEGEEPAGEAPSTEIVEAREKLRQQVKVSETLQKSLEDTREEIAMIQKRQKRHVDKALKKQQKKYDKRIQRREKIIEDLKKNHEADIQQKDAEIESIKKQLKIAQNALGTSDQKADTPDIDEDIAALKLEKGEVLEIVKAFEDEERAMVAKSQSGVPAEEEEISDTEIEH